MTSFISFDNTSVSINGKSNNVIKTKIDGEEVVQLRRAIEIQSGFNWLGRKVTEVKISDTILMDSMDIACFQWFVIQGIKVDLSRSYLSPLAVSYFNDACEWLLENEYKAPQGSSIRIPFLQRYSGIGLTDQTAENCQKIGFNAVY